MTSIDKYLSSEQVDAIINLALQEDLCNGDATTDALVPPDQKGKAAIIAVENGVLAGGEIAGRVFRKVDSSLKYNQLIKDGTRLKPDDVIGTVSGNMGNILKAERVALNFLMRLSGVATETAKYVEEIKGCPGKIYDTRKTTPGMRLLEKYAVRMGGGRNHRLNLGDAVLIKDNHIAALRTKEMSFAGIISTARRNAPEGMIIEIEVTTPEEAVEAAEAGADIIMLDNMNPEEMKKAIGSLPDGVRTEASGGINFSNVRAAAMSGVDIISVGALTHSFKALDIRVEYES